MYDTGEHNVEEISIDQFQFFWCIMHVFIVEFIEDNTEMGHFDVFSFYFFRDTMRKTIEMRMKLLSASKINGFYKTKSMDLCGYNDKNDGKWTRQNICLVKLFPHFIYQVATCR